jgi:hypothetical protein
MRGGRREDERADEDSRAGAALPVADQRYARAHRGARGGRARASEHRKPPEEIVMPQTFQSAEDLPRARHPLRPGEGVLQLFRKRSIAFDEFFPVLAKLTACIVREPL